MTNRLENRVKEARESGSIPQMHPNGFLLLPLNGEKRLHVWDDSFPRQEVSTPIHDHRFAFHSVVKLGRLTNTIYFVDREKEATHMRHEVVNGDGDETTLRPVANPEIALSVASSQLLEPGEGYVVHVGDIHESRNEGLTVTVIEKLKDVPAYTPSVFVPIGIVPDNSFTRDAMPLSEMWEAITEAVFEIE